MKFKLLIAAIILLGLFLRFHNYTQYPPRGASSDEYTYSFLGLSLLTTGVPTSWSYFPSYPGLGQRYDIKIDHIYFPIVSPYFDHPPLNGLLVGGWALINGENTFQKITIGTIRQVPIALWVISSILLYFIGRALYDKKTVAWGLLIYSVATLFVMETRTVFAENLLTPLLLGALLIFLTYRKRINILHIIILAIISGLSFWAKELGVTVGASIFLLMLLEKVKVKFIVIFSIITIVIISTYALYGYLYNWPLFLAILSEQSFRELGPNVLNTLLFNPIIVNKVYFDGWYLLGFISIFTALYEFKKHQYILIPAFTYFFLMMFSLTQHGEMGWYVIPLFPFFSLLTAHLLSESIKKGGLYIATCAVFVGLFIIRYYYEAKFGLPTIAFRLMLLGIFGPMIVFYLLKKDFMLKIFSNALFYIFIAMTIYITYYYIHPL